MEALGSIGKERAVCVMVRYREDRVCVIISMWAVKNILLAAGAYVQMQRHMGVSVGPYWRKNLPCKKLILQSLLYDVSHIFHIAQRLATAGNVSQRCAKI